MPRASRNSDDAVLDWERRLRSEAYVEKRINKPTE